MTKAQVNAMLDGYREAVGRFAHLEREMVEAREELRHAKAGALNDLLPGQQSSEPGGHGSSVGHPTERAALVMASGRRTKTVMEWEQYIASLSEEMSECRRLVQYVDAWLQGLTDKERWIVYYQIIDKRYWREIVPLFHTKFEEPYTRDGLKKIRKKALEKIYRIAL